MLLQKAMRYYRLWIYTCNVVLLLGVVVFAVTAGSVLSDTRSRFVPVPMYHPTFIYAYLALVAQGGLLQAVGCYGALRLNEKWLNFYWLAMLLLLVGDVLVGIVWIFLFSNITQGLPAELWARLQEDYGYDPQYTAAWNDLQQQLHCCGVHGPRDYNTTRWAFATPPSNNSAGFAMAVPNSCSLYTDGHSSLVIVPERQTDHYGVTLNGSLSNVTRAPYSTTSPSLIFQSSQNSVDIARQGCARLIQDWMQHCADVLFVLGYCVIAFLKLCFLGILRYEIKEMIQKIKILQGDMPAFPEIMSLGLHSPASQHKNCLAELSNSHPNHLDLLMNHTDPATNHLLNKKSASNGNNNDLELIELTRNLS